MSLTNISKVTLRLLDPVNGQTVQRWDFDAPTHIRIGRGDDNDVVIGSQAVSRQHAELMFDSDGWKLRSLGRNGTLVDGARVGAALPVRGGMLIQLGATGPALEFGEGGVHLPGGETITNLHIEDLGMLRVDEQQKQAEVAKITGDEGFQQLLEKARQLRRKPADETSV